MTDNGVAGSRAVELEADLALVALDEKDLDRNDRRTHALELISQLVHEARCPVIAVIENENPEFIARAAANGISAYACPIGHDEIVGAVNVGDGPFSLRWDRRRRAPHTRRPSPLPREGDGMRALRRLLASLDERGDKAGSRA